MTDPRHVLELLREVIVAQLGGVSAEVAPVATPCFMTVEEYAARVRLAPGTVRRMVREGLPHVRPRPRRVRIKVQEADAWMEGRSGDDRWVRSARVQAHKGSVQ